MAIIPTWRNREQEQPTPLQELKECLVRLERHRRLALVELRQIERLLTANPELRSRLPGGATQGDLSRPRLVVNNNKRRGVRRQPLPRERLF